jgi:hypothetical protein
MLRILLASPLQLSDQRLAQWESSLDLASRGSAWYGSTGKARHQLDGLCEANLILLGCWSSEVEGTGHFSHGQYRPSWRPWCHPATLRQLFWCQSVKSKRGCSQGQSSFQPAPSCTSRYMTRRCSVSPAKASCLRCCRPHYAAYRLWCQHDNRCDSSIMYDYYESFSARSICTRNGERDIRIDGTR